jgi:signal transduction histidine kinase
MWVYSRCGLIAISQEELNRWWSKPDSVVQTRVFDVLDGVRPGPSTFQPAASKSPDGQLWFVNDEVVQMLDPGHLTENMIPPPVHIERVFADHREYPAGASLRFPPRTRDIEIEYTALSLLIPQEVRFRYMLDGRDTQWQEAGTRRQVFYNDLPPGQYRFHVIASNNDSVWNQTGDSFNLNILPAWYQTIWFRILCAGGAIVLLAFAYQLRVRKIAVEMNMRFDERLAERTRLAGDFHDTLIQTIQGSKMIADSALDEDVDPARMRRVLERLAEWLGQAVEEGRSALVTLRTSTTQRNDLSEDLQRAMEECRFQRNIELDVSVDGSGKEMHPIVRDEVYRIGYEAIRNACNHSGATRLSIALSYTSDLVLSVRDNGSGIAPEIAAKGRSGHFGLIGMYERASRMRGKLTVSSSPGGGTEVELVVPRSIVFQRESASKGILRRIVDFFQKRNSADVPPKE